MNSIETSFRVGDWRVDPVLKQLARGEEIVRIDPRNMRVLVLLASRPGEVVSQSEIERVLGNGAVVTPESVYQSIAQLRRALGGDKSRGRYIETVSRKGYRLIAAVIPGSGTATPDQADAATSAVSAAARERDAPRRRWLLVSTAVAVLASIFVVAFALLSARDGPASHAAQASREAEQITSAAQTADMNVDSLPAALPSSHQGANYYRRSIQRLLQALNSQSASLGENDISLVPTLIALANLYPLVSEPLKCEQVARRGLAILVRHGQEKSSEGVELNATLAEALADTERYAEAERHLRRAYDYSRQIHGDLEYPTISAVDQMALLRIAQGRFEEGVVEARRAVALYEQTPQASNTRTAYLRSTLMWALVEQGRHAEAIREGTIAMDAITPQDAPAPYLVALANHFLGESLVKAGRYREAETVLRRELALLMTIPHCEMDSARAASGLAEALMRQGQIQEASQLLTGAARTLEVGDGWRERKARRDTRVRLEQLRALQVGSSIARLAQTDGQDP